MATVLVVDDEAALVHLVADILTDLGHEAVGACNGQEALDLLADLPQNPACIVSDLMMPLVDGLELTRRVRAHPELADIPIILMSAAVRPPTNGGITAFIAKPFQLDDLITLIDPFL